MSDLERFAVHCRAMATAEHKPECCRCGRPYCCRCVGHPADEVDAYLDPHPTLWKDHQ